MRWLFFFASVCQAEKLPISGLVQRTTTNWTTDFCECVSGTAMACVTTEDGNEQAFQVNYLRRLNPKP